MTLQITEPAVIDALDRFKNVGQEVATIAIERDDAINGLMLAVLAESHIFMAGLPGVAKSLVFSQFFSRVENASIGHYTVTKGSTAETLVGPISLEKMKNEDRIWYNTKGMLPENDFAYITEVFKGNAMTLNIALQILNERAFLNSGEVQQCPLRTCAADSNEYADSREMAAFWDRFLVRVHVDPIHDFGKKMDMVRQSLVRGRRFPTSQPGISLQDIKLLNEFRSTITIPAGIEEAALQLYNGLYAEEIKLGDRRFCDTFYLAAANAMLKGRQEMVTDDLLVFQYTAWNNPDQRKTVQQAILGILAPELANVTKMYDEITDAYEQFLVKKKDADQSNNTEGRKAAMAASHEFGQAAEAHITDIKQHIMKIQRNGRDASLAVEMLQKSNSMVEHATRLAMRRSGDDFDNNYDPTALAS